MAMPRLAGGDVDDVLAVDQHAAGGRVLQPGDDAQQRRLAAAGRADEDDELAVLHLEVDALQHLDRAEGLASRFSMLQRAHGFVPVLEFDGCAGAHALVGGKADGERLHRVVHVARRDRYPRGSPSARRPARGRRAPGGRARPAIDSISSGCDEFAVGAGLGAVQADASRSWCGCRCRRTWRLPSMTIETQPLGEITSFTKKAVSEIIGPQPASYQPTEPSSNSTCRWP